jgi:hypothetical protein
MTPEELHNLHREAMDLSFRASYALVQKDEPTFRLLMSQAYEKERKAAMFLHDRLEVEPTRSILFRSAASMAMQLGKYREAEQLIAWGLVGNPPEYEADILREVYEEIRKAQQRPVPQA